MKHKQTAKHKKQANKSTRISRMEDRIAKRKAKTEVAVAEPPMKVVHHIDGDNNNNEASNLEIIDPDATPMSAARRAFQNK